MRIKISFTENNKPVPVDNQYHLNSYIHKCLGNNNKYHNAKSDYSISHLYGGTLNKSNNTLNFEKGGYIIISSMDKEFMGALFAGIYANQLFGFGMQFKSVDNVAAEYFYAGWNHFATLSPFIIKEYQDKKNYTFLTLDDPNFEYKVKQYLIRKIRKINPRLDLSDFDINIKTHEKHKIKKILIKNVINHANQCQISIYTNPKVAKLLYHIGIGQSTGSGLGTIYPTSKHSFYREVKIHSGNVTKVDRIEKMQMY